MSQLKVDFFITTLVGVINQLQHCDVKENLNEVVISGSWNQHAVGLITHFLSVENTNRNEIFSLIIDSQAEDLEDISNIPCSNSVSEFTLTFRKHIFLTIYGMISDEIDVFLFSSVVALNDSLVQLGITNPLFNSAINKRKATKILVHGLKHNFGGPYLAVLSTSGSPDLNVYLRGSSLPDADTVRKEVNTMSNFPIDIVPQFFEISWGSINSAEARPFRIAYAKQMICCMAQYVYSEEKIQMKGLKSLECSIADDGSQDINANTLDTLKKCVIWCFESNDAASRIQLIVDRVSIDCTNGGKIINACSSIIPLAFDQAKEKYKFVISKRSDDYRKEMKELYNDIKLLINAYADKSSSLSDGLVKDVLSISFIVTVGAFAKAISQAEVLQTLQAETFFFATGVFLLLSMVIKRVHALMYLRDLSHNLTDWAESHSTHVSQQELETKIEKLLKGPKLNFKIIVGFVEAIYIVLAIGCFQYRFVMSILGF